MNRLRRASLTMDTINSDGSLSTSETGRMKEEAVSSSMTKFPTKALSITGGSLTPRMLIAIVAKLKEDKDQIEKETFTTILRLYTIADDKPP